MAWLIGAVAGLLGVALAILVWIGWNFAVMLDEGE